MISQSIDDYKIITLCGSTKFKPSFEEVTKQLTLKNKIVLAPGFYIHYDKVNEITIQEKEQLDKLHKEKIDLSDCIIVINEDNYIGFSTRNEIDYANKTGKPVFYLYEV